MCLASRHNASMHVYSSVADADEKRACADKGGFVMFLPAMCDAVHERRWHSKAYSLRAHLLKA